jgi:hypothetical protein
MDEVKDVLSVAVAEPVAVTGELGEMLEQLERRGIRALRDVLGRPLLHVTGTDLAVATTARAVIRQD